MGRVVRVRSEEREKRQKEKNADDDSNWEGKDGGGLKGNIAQDAEKKKKCSSFRRNEISKMGLVFGKNNREVFEKKKIERERDKKGKKNQKDPTSSRQSAGLRGAGKEKKRKEDGEND